MGGRAVSVCWGDLIVAGGSADYRGQPHGTEAKFFSVSGIWSRHPGAVRGSGVV